MILLYEYIMTIDQEVAAVWRRGKRSSLVSLLLISTRWCMVIAGVSSLGITNYAQVGRVHALIERVLSSCETEVRC